MGLAIDGYDVKGACVISQWKIQKHNVNAQSDSNFPLTCFHNQTFKGKQPLCILKMAKKQDRKTELYKW